MTEEEVFVRAYCAALTGVVGSGIEEDPVDIRDLCTIFSVDAVQIWRNRSTKPGQGERSDLDSLITQFVRWREEVDQDAAPNIFDIALAWFSGKGLDHDIAYRIAKEFDEGTLPLGKHVL